MIKDLRDKYKYLKLSIFLIGSSLILNGCATVGEPRMIAPNTYTIVGSGTTNAMHNMEDKFLERMQNHCQSLGKYPLVRKNNVQTQVINAFGDKTYDGSLIYECIDAAEYSKSKQHFDEVTPIQRIEEKITIEHK